MNYEAAEVLRWFLITRDPPIASRPSDLRGSKPPDVRNMPAWPCFVPNMNTDGNNAISIRGTAGVSQGRFMRTGEQQINPGVQIRIRASDYPTGSDKGIQIIGLLDRIIQPVTVLCGDEQAPYTIYNCSRKGNLIYLGQEDEKQRGIFVVNYVLTLSGGDF